MVAVWVGFFARIGRLINHSIFRFKHGVAATDETLHVWPQRFADSWNGYHKVNVIHFKAAVHCLRSGFGGGFTFQNAKLSQFGRAAYNISITASGARRWSIRLQLAIGSSFGLTNKTRQKFLSSISLIKPSCSTGRDIIKSPTCSNTRTLYATLGRHRYKPNND